MAYTMDRTLLVAKQTILRLNAVLSLAKNAEVGEDQQMTFFAAYKNAKTAYSDFQLVNKQTLFDESDATLMNSIFQQSVDIDGIFFQIEGIYFTLFENKSTKIKSGSSLASADASPAISPVLSRAASVQSISQANNVRLPRIQLPTFSGNLKDWPTFVDLFTTLIHKNDSLSSIEKFQYLISTLSSEPLTMVKHLPLTADNYTIAYQSLVDRYQNKRVLVSFYWQSLVNAPKASDNLLSLRNLLNTFSENVTALNLFKQDLDFWNFTLFNWLLQKLDNSVRKRFELEFASEEFPDFDTLKQFLADYCRALETNSLALAGPQGSSSDFKPGFKSSQRTDGNRKTPLSHTLVVQASQQRRCEVCHSNHSIYQCENFKSKSPKDRYHFVRENKLCLNCLSSSHRIQNCRSAHSCSTCSSKHHSLLHFTDSNPPTEDPSSSSSQGILAQQISTVKPVNSMANIVPSHKTVLLSTAVVVARDKFGNSRQVRTLIDSGSEISLITEKCLNRLGLLRSSSSIFINGINHMSTTSSKGLTRLEISSRCAPLKKFVIEAVVVPTICDKLPSSPVSLDHWTHIRNLDLADPFAGQSREIELLLGAELFPYILKDGRRIGKPNEPVAINSIFGWILSGSVNQEASSQAHSFCTVVDNPLDVVLKRFWELEEVPHCVISSPLDIRCEEIFSSTHIRDDSGRFIVNLPFCENPPLELGDSYTFALRRFLALENRLQKHPQLYADYCKFMKEYLDSNHMSLISPSIGRNLPYYYIPHHCVLKADSSTTRLRVVFDASTKTSNDRSLNDILLPGPKLQTDISRVLLLFRLHAFALIADIKQMYRQILVHPTHRTYQRILWRFTPLEPIQEYVLNTVTYGVTSAPFLALRTVKQLAIDGSGRYPRASKVLISDIYVDDVVTGADSLSDAFLLQEELISLLSEGGFVLRKWASNDPKLMASLPAEYQQLSFDSDDQTCIKVLGLHWNPTIDSFTYKVSSLTGPCTKRSILSEIARIFDPLGFLSPLTFFAKHLIQHLWSLGIDWDAIPPSNVVASWNQYKSELQVLADLKIPRCCRNLQFVTCELHGFCDSSELGYAAVVYLRVIEQNGPTNIFLVVAKSKVAPLKRISIPRLELCAAVLLSDLMGFVIDTYSEKLHFSNIFAWSDSMVALSWIRSSPHRWKTFISNRVSHIQDIISPSCWHHVSSSDNPADCASRGLLPVALLHNNLWWNGPSWLLDTTKWPSSVLDDVDRPLTLVEEERSRSHVLAAFHTTPLFDSLLKNYSNLDKISRIIAYCLRYCHNSRSSTNKNFGSFSRFDLHQALLELIKEVQSQVFVDEISLLRRGELPSKRIRNLAPFIHEDGLLRVGGRLARSDLPFNSKHPILLPRKHRLTELIIENYHIQNFHPGLRTLHGLLAQNYWILSAKRAIRSCVSKCNRCFRVKPIALQPPMGNLPPSRITQIKPFQCTGVDYGGPFTITLGKHRGAKTSKAYLCLFVCFTTKALHLELASDLSSDAFLAALRRFLARRGPCTRLFSDCGTNFIGANRMLVTLMKDAAESEKLEWHFNPPSAPHFGGLWEAGVKSVKSHLTRVIGEQILTFEELYTFFTQVEAILNSRPLCPVSSDPNDLIALTPGHFLFTAPPTLVPDPDLSHLKINRLDRWQLLQRLVQDLWKRWHLDYLHTLQQRQKWTDPSPTIEIGTLVLIKEDNVPPLKWRLGRISNLHLGHDGKARVADIRTSHGTCQRPLVKICPLPRQ